jgi:hypothetical protein
MGALRYGLISSKANSSEIGLDFVAWLKIVDVLVK